MPFSAKTVAGASNKVGCTGSGILCGAQGEEGGVLEDEAEANGLPLEGGEIGGPGLVAVVAKKGRGGG